MADEHDDRDSVRSGGRSTIRIRGPLVVLGLLYLLAALADPIAPYAEGEGLQQDAFHPPTPLHLTENSRLVRPYVYPLVAKTNLRTFVVEWHEDRSRKVPLLAFVHRRSDPLGALLGALAGATGGIIDSGVIALSDALSAAPGLY